MTTRKRTRITVETERLLIISRRQGAMNWCAGCNKRVKMISVDEAAALTQVSSRTIYRWVEAEKLHFIESTDGLLRICARSLYRSIQNSKGQT